mgnify:FL=1
MPEQTGYTYPAVTGERFLGFVLLAGIPEEGLGEAFLSFGDIQEFYRQRPAQPPPRKDR